MPSSNPHSQDIPLIHIPFIETIYQMVEDSNRKCKLLSINQYDADFMAALQPCLSDKEFKANYAYVYLSHLSPEYQLVIKDIFPKSQDPTPLDSRLKRKRLQQVKVAGMTAASCLQVTQTIANQSVQSYTTLAGAFPSQAKQTLGKYQNETKPEPEKCIPMSVLDAAPLIMCGTIRPPKQLFAPKRTILASLPMLIRNSMPSKQGSKAIQRNNVPANLVAAEAAIPMPVQSK